MRLVLTAAGVEGARDLDRASPRHPLVQGVSTLCRFESIAHDGYDPERVMATVVSLRKYVAGKSNYEAAEEAYKHPLWAHLLSRVGAGDSTWLARKLKHYRVLQFGRTDDYHAVSLGLIPQEKEDLLPEDVQPPLDLKRERFATLDGLLFLLLLHREAQDAGHTLRARRLGDALRDAAVEFAGVHQYRDEVLDTWTVLVETRMVSWAPLFAPDGDSCRDAEEQLRIKRTKELTTKRTRSPISPDELKPNTRSGRRWRRQVWARACCVQFRRGEWWPSFDYRDASVVRVVGGPSGGDQRAHSPGL